MKRLQRLASIAVLSSVVLAAACSQRSEPEPAAENAAPSAQPAPAPSQPAANPQEPPGEAVPAQQQAQPSTGEQRAATAQEGAEAKEAAPAERGADTPAGEPATGAAAAPCGEKGQPPCPLQGWMERNLQKPLDDGDLARVAKSLARVPKLVPEPSWNEGEQGWSKIADGAAAAAKAKDADAVEQGCKTCHRTWRKKYKQSFRLRPVND